VDLRGQDGILRLVAWPPAAPVVLASHGDEVRGVAMTPDGKTLLWGSLDQQVLVQLEGMPPKALAAGGRVTSVALSADGSLAAASVETGLVKFWKTSDGTDAGLLSGHTGAVTSVALNPKQPLVATAGADGTVRIWRHSALPAGWAGHTQPAAVLAVSRDGKQALSAGADLSVRIWTVADGQQVAAWEKLPQAVTAAKFTTDGESVVLGMRAETSCSAKLPTDKSCGISVPTAGRSRSWRCWRTDKSRPPDPTAWSSSGKCPPLATRRSCRPRARSLPHWRWEMERC
jgi:cytochrome c